MDVGSTRVMGYMLTRARVECNTPTERTDRVLFFERAMIGLPLSLSSSPGPRVPYMEDAHLCPYHLRIGETGSSWVSF
jgi:hypothetical protein